MTDATRGPIAEAAPPPEAAATATEEERTLLGRIRGYLPWLGAAALVLAVFRALKWWGDQQQRAALRGRAWPPLPVRVFLRGS